MNHLAFDELTRALSDARPRRSFIRALLGSGLAGALAIDLRGSVEAKKRKRCGPCRKKRRGKCRTARPDGTPCGQNGFCQAGTCRECRQLASPCTADFECCSGICDRYSGTCSDTRIACDPTIADQCGNGLCCPDEFVPPTGHRCFNDPLNNTTACGTTCETIENCLNIAGQTRCQNGQCCCLEATCTRPEGPPVPPCAP